MATSIVHRENCRLCGSKDVELILKLEPIPLSDLVLQKITGIAYPSWIQSVHELQNWYYWQHEKKELQIND